MGIFAGDRPIIVGVLTAIGVEQGVLYWRYRHPGGRRQHIARSRSRPWPTSWPMSVRWSRCTPTSAAAASGTPLRGDR